MNRQRVRKDLGECRLSEKESELAADFLQLILDESEGGYRSLFENMKNGFAYCKMLFEGDEAKDFTYLNVNNAFETLTGLRNVTGKNASEVIPGIRDSHPELFEVYGRVALTGNPEHFETWVEPLAEWFSISVYSPKKDYFAVEFDVITQSKRAEEHTRHLASIPQMNPNPVIEVDASGAITFSNPAAHEVLASLGLDKEDFQVLLPEDLRALWEEWDKKSEPIVHREVTVRDTVFHETVHFIPHFNVVRIYADDVTERKNAEKVLRISREQLSDAADLAHIVYWEADPGTGEFIFNDPFYALFGTTAEREGGYRMPLAEYPTRFVHPDDLERYYGNAERINTSRQELTQFEHRIVRRDGEVRHILNRASLVWDPAGRLVRVYGANQDITERKVTEEALRWKTAFLESLLHTSSDGIIVIDGEGKTILQNQRTVDLWKIPQEIADRKDDEAQLRHILSVVKDPDKFSRQVLYLHSHPKECIRDEVALLDGTVLERYSSPLVGTDGTYYGRIWGFHDITERKRTEGTLAGLLAELESKNEKLEAAYLDLKESQQKILQQEKMASIGQLAAGVAHEINNPMGFIMSNLNSLQKYMARIPEFIEIQSEALRQNGTSREDVADKRRSLKIDYILEDSPSLIKESLEGADRVKRIVQDLKNFSRVDVTEYALADINKVLESTLNIVRNELKHKATLKKEYGEIPLVRCNAGQLSQVFMNILVNAAQAIADFGEITIETRQVAEHLYVAISDTGSGIPQEKLDRIFEPFFTTKEIGKGTGLGLSIAYDIVKKHKGDIEVLSEVGKGTTFVVAIPVGSE